MTERENQVFQIRFVSEMRSRKKKKTKIHIPIPSSINMRVCIFENAKFRNPCGSFQYLQYDPIKWKRMK